MYLSFNEKKDIENFKVINFSKIKVHFELKEREFFFENNHAVLFLVSDANIKDHVAELFKKNTQLSILEIVKAFQNEFFAVLIDKKTEEIHVLRDTSGLNTGYYFLTSNGLCISNLVHEIAETYRTPLSKESVFQFLYSNFVWDGQTLYENILEFPMGSAYKFDFQLNLIEHEVPKLEFDSQENNLTEKENIQQLRQEIVDAHKKYINTQNVILLSGGIDSVAMMIALDDLVPKNNIEAHSYKVKNAEGDETVYAKSISDHLNISLKIFENDLQYKLTSKLFEETVLQMNIPYIGVHVFGDNFKSTDKITYYAGQDTRLHTPSVNKIDTIAFSFFKLFNNFRFILVVLDKLMALLRICLNFLNAGKSKNRAIRGLYRATYIFNTQQYILKYYFGIDRNAINHFKIPLELYNTFKSKYHLNLSKVKNERGLYNAIVGLKWKEQYVTDIRYMKDMARMKGAYLAMPFYDMKMAEFSAHIPFKLAVKQMLGKAKFGETKEMIYKYVLRKSLEDKIDKKTYFRSKAAPGTSYAMFNASLSNVLKSILNNDLENEKSFIKEFELKNFISDFMNKKEKWGMDDEGYLIKIYNTAALVIYYNQINSLKQ